MVGRILELATSKKGDHGLTEGETCTILLQGTPSRSRITDAIEILKIIDPGLDEVSLQQTTLKLRPVLNGDGTLAALTTWKSRELQVTPALFRFVQGADIPNIPNGLYIEKDIHPDLSLTIHRNDEATLMIRAMMGIGLTKEQIASLFHRRYQNVLLEMKRSSMRSWQFASVHIIGKECEGERTTSSPLSMLHLISLTCSST